MPCQITFFLSGESLIEYKVLTRIWTGCFLDNNELQIYQLGLLLNCITFLHRLRHIWIHLHLWNYLLRKSMKLSI